MLALILTAPFGVILILFLTALLRCQRLRHPSGNGNSIECPEGFDALGRRIILTARLPDSGKLCRVAIQNESMLIRDFREPEWRDTLSHMLGVARVRPGDGNPSASSTSS